MLSNCLPSESARGSDQVFEKVAEVVEHRERFQKVAVGVCAGGVRDRLSHTNIKDVVIFGILGKAVFVY